MPYQDLPFNGDFYIENKILSLSAQFNIQTVIETGTAIGTTTTFFANHFREVYSLEINQNYFDIASIKLKEYSNIHLLNGDSGYLISRLELTGNCLFYLDAHWYGHNPLLNELMSIQYLQKKCKGFRPFIAIHDFQVPGDEKLGFDQFNSKWPICFDLVHNALKSIYGSENFIYSYNSFIHSAGAKRGIIYILPASS